MSGSKVLGGVCRRLTQSEQHLLVLPTQSAVDTRLSVPLSKREDRTDSQASLQHCWNLSGLKHPMVSHTTYPLP